MTFNNFNLKQILTEKEYQKYLKISILNSKNNGNFDKSTAKLIENIVIYGE
jgi:hypothetical protein